MEKNTPLSMHVLPGHPDYHPENPGGKPEGGRSLDNDLFSFEELGPWAERINRHPHARIEHTTRLEREALDRSVPQDEIEARRARDLRGDGQALIGSLLKALLDREIPLHTSTRARELVLDDDGAVIGVRAERDGAPFNVKARRAVVIASGGFEWNSALNHFIPARPHDRPRLHPGERRRWPPDGDGRRRRPREHE